MNREQAMKRYNLLKSQRHLEEFMDYDPAFLRRLSDKDLIYLVEFLTNFYNGAETGRTARAFDMHAQSDEIVSPNEVDDRYMDYEENSHLISFGRPSAQ